MSQGYWQYYFQTVTIEMARQEHENVWMPVAH